jgi:hypothetical protein
MFTDSASKEEMDNYKHKVQESGKILIISCFKFFIPRDWTGGSIKYEYDIIKGMAISVSDGFAQSFASDPVVSTMGKYTSIQLLSVYTDWINRAWRCGQYPKPKLAERCLANESHQYR